MIIIEHAPTRLIIRSKRGMMAVTMTLFLILSVLTVFIILGYGIQMLTTNFTWWRLLGYFVWQPVSIALVVIGIMFWNNAMRGLTLTFDRETESVIIRKPKLFKMHEDAHSIYSISRMEMELMPQGRVFAVYLTLKSGEQIPIASISAFDEEPTRDLMKIVREFLQAK